MFLPICWAKSLCFQFPVFNFPVNTSIEMWIESSHLARLLCIMNIMMSNMAGFKFDSNDKNERWYAFIINLPAFFLMSTGKSRSQRSNWIHFRFWAFLAMSCTSKDQPLWWVMFVDELSDWSAVNILKNHGMMVLTDELLIFLWWVKPTYQLMFDM